MERTGAGESLPTVDIESGELATLLELAAAVFRLAGSPEQVVCGRFRLGDVRDAHADVDDARAVLGYVRKTGFADGVAQLLAWIARSDQTATAR